ncbi:MAG TPA: PhzF family phenazine biosynthesis protein [Longimicrobiaceae bacterium]|nr:PhzF family phenazine biosynthesis protein [Longimicrobiaceae bacterium]
MPTEIQYHTLDVFTDRTFGGNPLAVFPAADRLSDDEMQAIALEMNLSETVFVVTPTDPRCTHRVQIFTPRTELPFAGHPTVGTACLLASLGQVALADHRGRVVFEEGVGPVAVEISAPPGGPLYAELTAACVPERGQEVPESETLASVLSLDLHDIGTNGWEPDAYSSGVPFVFVPVRDRGALARVRVNRSAWSEHLEDAWASKLYVFTLDPEREGSDVRARMFAPGIGIDEDPATGGAAAAFAGYLADRVGPPTGGTGPRRWVIEQGFEMGRPSLLHAEASFEGGRLAATRVGGSAVRVCDGVLRLPADAGETH